MSAEDIRFDVHGALGRITLHRPDALNALTQDMAARLFDQLQAWSADSAVGAVLIKSGGGKAFCAGGDVIRLYNDGRAKGPYPKLFYRTEYRCNALIKRLNKPYIAVMDGIVMGGGVGIAIHGSHRIVTENTVLAMPETGIGLFPDVGGTYFLSRLSGRMGLYLGLTGRRLTGADCMAVGLADAFVPAAKVGAIENALMQAQAPDAAVATAAITAPAAPIAAEVSSIEKHFAFETVEEILASLDHDASPWAAKTAQSLRQKAPLSLKVTERQLRLGAALSFEDAMRLEWRLANRFADDLDFYEGVRALLIEKSMKPQWRPATLADVSSEQVDAYFAPLAEGELDLTGIHTET